MKDIMKEEIISKEQQKTKYQDIDFRIKAGKICMMILRDTKKT